MISTSLRPLWRMGLAQVFQASAAFFFNHEVLTFKAQRLCTHMTWRMIHLRVFEDYTHLRMILDIMFQNMWTRLFDIVCLCGKMKWWIYIWNNILDSNMTTIHHLSQTMAQYSHPMSDMTLLVWRCRHCLLDMYVTISMIYIYIYDCMIMIHYAHYNIIYI